MTFMPGRSVARSTELRLHALRLHCEDSGARGETHPRVGHASLGAILDGHHAMHFNRFAPDSVHEQTGEVARRAVPALMQHTATTPASMGLADPFCPRDEAVAPESIAYGRPHVDLSHTASLTALSQGNTGHSHQPRQSTAPTCPALLPRCLNTWLFSTPCESNADSDCFCPDPTFVSRVAGCTKAWASSTKEGQMAAAYLAGICAPQIQSYAQDLSWFLKTDVAAVRDDGICSGQSESADEHSIPCTTITVRPPNTRVKTMPDESTIATSIPEQVMTLMVPWIELHTSTAIVLGQASVQRGATQTPSQRGSSTWRTPAYITLETSTPSSRLNNTATNGTGWGGTSGFPTKTLGPFVGGSSSTHPGYQCTFLAMLLIYVLYFC